MNSIVMRLKNSALFRRLEWTPLHRMIIRIRNPGYEASLKADAAFYRHLAKRGYLVFDVGANYGSKTEVFLGLGARVVAVEPDPQCCRILRQRFPFSRNLSLEAKAVGETVGKLELFSQTPGSAYNTLCKKWHDIAHASATASTQVEVTTLDELIRKHGMPAFLKIDVEGFEREALRGLSAPVPAISFEANLPEFRCETIECIDRLEALDSGYRFIFLTSLTVWAEPTLTAEEARHQLEQADGYCEIFAIRSPGEAS